MAATAHAPRVGRLREAQEGPAALIPAATLGTYVALLEAHAGEGR
jgi:hypothetical protein